MSAEVPQPYKLELSDRVYARLVELSAAARVRGDRPAFMAALREFDRRLRVYPQFGDPLTDLRHEPGHIRIGVVPPLTMRYAVLEERRLVFVAALPVLLPKPRA